LKGKVKEKIRKDKMQTLFFQLLCLRPGWFIYSSLGLGAKYE